MSAEGRLILEVEDGDGIKRLQTLAPLDEYEVGTRPVYRPAENIFDAFEPPVLLHVDLTVRVRLAAGSRPDGVLYQTNMMPPGETTEEIVTRVVHEHERTRVGLAWARVSSLALIRELTEELKKAGRV